MVIKIVKRYSGLPRQINERNAEEAYRNDKQCGNSILVLDVACHRRERQLRPAVTIRIRTAMCRHPVQHFATALQIGLRESTGLAHWWPNLEPGATT